MSIHRRRALITQMLDTDEPRTQEEIVSALAQAGVKATQATVSRDLAALGVVRGPEGYRLAGTLSEKQGMSSDLANLLGAHALGIRQAHSMIVIKTAPGHAQLLAVGFDRTPPSGVAGCLAGDDTIFLATASPKTAGIVIDLLNAQLEGDAS